MDENSPSPHKESRLPSAESLKRLAISESGFVFDPVSGHSFSVNETGIEIIHLLQQGLGLTEIIVELSKHFSGEAHIVERDILEFTGLLRDQVDAG